MTIAEKAKAYDLISELVADEQKTERFYDKQKDMSAHIESVQAHAFRNIRRKFFAD